MRFVSPDLWLPAFIEVLQTFWLLQDLLAQYISSTTALDLSKYIAQYPDEVNILAFGYGEVDGEPTSPIVELSDSTFYAGSITENVDNSVSNGFLDIVKIITPPDKDHLWRSLFKKAPCGNITWK